MKPLVLVNFKVYFESAGNRAIELSKQLARVKSLKFKLAVAPSLLTTREITQKTNLTVFAQYADKVDYGAYTGSVSVSELKESRVEGVILNHSEHKIHLLLLGKIVDQCKNQRLITVVCASTLNEVKQVAKYNPDYVAYEPKELIGGNVSVTTANASIITQAVQLVKKLSPKTKVLCGAGIHSREDLHQALKLGTQGVLLAHAVCKAKDPKRFLEEMLS